MKIRVRTKQDNYEFECAEGQRILYAGLSAGVPLPYECATGTCGTCKARAKPGTVTPLWPQAPGASYLKPERGEFLMCQACAEQDCEILVPAKPLPERAGAVAPAPCTGTLRNRLRLTADVMSFDVYVDRPVRFLPGQFVLLGTDALEGVRAYSMVNHARTCDRLSFVVKRKPKGAFSDWLFDVAGDGAPLTVFGPLGRATFDPNEGKNMLAIAGGSGIAGIMSMLASAGDSDYFHSHSGNVFFGVRTAADAFFIDELDHHAEQAQGRLKVTVALSDQDADDAQCKASEHVRFATGFVHRVAAERMAGAFDNVVAFVAGPPPMVDGALRMLVIDGQLPAGDIRYDKFG